MASEGNNDLLFDPIKIGNIEFPNRVWRSSLGGRHATYDGAVTEAWRNFEARFAKGGAGAVISTTFHVNQHRLSPMQYPSIAHGKFVPRIEEYIRQIRDAAPIACRYIVQIGDPGYVTYDSLFHDPQDARSASRGFDIAYGYTNTRKGMSDAEIHLAIEAYAQAALRVRDARADGVEITAAKGYLIHQFLNPGFNRRTDGWGGSPDKRFEFLRRVIERTKELVYPNGPDPDFLLGVRLAGADFNWAPLQFSLLRLPWPFLSRERRVGNELPQMLEYARRLKALGVDFLHIVSGLGFPSPRVTPGKFPFEEVRIFFNATRHLSGKAAFRASVFNTLPDWFMRWFMNLGWEQKEAINLEMARQFKLALGPDYPIIVNGGFESRESLERARRGGIDVVSMARALLANPNLPEIYRRREESELPPCSRCNKCVARTATSPLGCYDIERFGKDREAMIRQILAWNRQDVEDRNLKEFELGQFPWPLIPAADDDANLSDSSAP